MIFNPQKQYMHLLCVEVERNKFRKQTKTFKAHSGFKPGTSCFLSKNHTPRPMTLSYKLCLTALLQLTLKNYAL